MKTISTLKKYIKNMSGNVIGIGINDSTILDCFNKNNKIIMVDLLNSSSTNDLDSFFSKRKKKLYVRNLRKKYKKKKIDYMVVNTEEISSCLKTFIKDSVYINKNKIYFFSKRKSILQLIEKRYKRYKSISEIIKQEDGYILKVDVSGAKNRIIMDKIYYILDTLYNISDMISNFLIN